MIKISDNLEVIVIANKRKKILTTEMLKNIDHRVFYTTDYDLPMDINIDCSLVPIEFQLGAYRCFRGHQDAIISCTKENILVFEDDALTNDDHWINKINDGIGLLKMFDIVSFHNRVCTFKHCNSIKVNNNIFYYPVRQGFWCTASLAYVIKKETVDNICRSKYVGIPIDIFYIRNFKFCFLNPSPFIHDRSMGSLIDGFGKNGKQL